MTRNDAAQWRERGPADLSHLHPTYPRDERETIDDAYENHAPTNTAGGYLDALERVRSGDPDLPKDFDAYLAQRVPSARHLGEMEPATPIDRRGRIG